MSCIKLFNRIVSEIDSKFSEFPINRNDEVRCYLLCQFRSLTDYSLAIGGVLSSGDDIAFDGLCRLFVDLCCDFFCLAEDSDYLESLKLGAHEQAIKEVNKYKKIPGLEEQINLKELDESEAFHKSEVKRLTNSGVKQKYETEVCKKYRSNNVWNSVYNGTNKFVHSDLTALASRHILTNGERVTIQKSQKIQPAYYTGLLSIVLKLLWDAVIVLDLSLSEAGFNPSFESRVKSFVVRYD